MATASPKRKADKSAADEEQVPLLKTGVADVHEKILDQSDADEELAQLSSTVERADFMIVFKLAKRKSGKNSNIELSDLLQIDDSNDRIDCSTLMEYAFEDITDCEAFGQEFPRLAKDCAERRTKHKLKDIREDLLLDLCDWLPEQGLQVRLFKSVDDSMMFMRVTIEDPRVERALAERQSVRIQTDFRVVQKLGIKQPPPPETSPPYVTYSAKLIDSMIKELNLEERDMFREFYSREVSAPEGAIFRQVDRVRMIRNIISSKMYLSRLKEKSIILHYFSVHKLECLIDFRHRWATLRFFPSWSQPLDDINDYFGSFTAFYFAWIGFTCRWLVPLTVGGVLITAFEYFLDYDGTIWGPPWAVFMVAWSSLYFLFWERRQDRLRREWDTFERARFDVQRAKFHGELKPNPLNFNDVSVQYPPSRTRFWMLFSFVVTLVFFGIMLVCVAAVYAVRPYLVRTYPDDSPILYFINGRMISSSLMSVQIWIFNTLWEQVAFWLTEKENLRTVTMYTNALILKLFTFQLVNTYQGLFYLALVQRYWGPSDDENCPDDDCIAALRHELYTTIISFVLMEVAKSIFPYLKLKWDSWHNRKQLGESWYAKLAQEGVIASEELPKITFMEEQVNQSPVHITEQVSAFQSLSLHFSFVVIFCSVAPLLGVIVFFAFTIRLRLDAWKLCVLNQRPFPHIADGIGGWNHIIKAFTWIGLMSSIAIPVANMTQFRHYDNVHKLALVLVLEHLLIVVKFFFSSIFGRVSAATRLMVDRREYVLERIHKFRASYTRFGSVQERGMKTPNPKEATKLFSVRSRHNIEFG